MEEKYKKRKWCLPIILMLIKALADIAILQIQVNMATTSKNYAAVKAYGNSVVNVDMWMGLLVFAGTAVWIHFAIKDQRYEVRYHFWVAGLWALLTTIIGVGKGIYCDIILWENERLLAQQNGEDLRGHGAPALTILYMALGFAYFLVIANIGAIGQKRYKNMRHDYEIAQQHISDTDIIEVQD